MIKVFKLVFLLLLSTGCDYEPILIKNNYNYNFVEINSSGNQEINRIIKNKLLLSTKKKTKTNYKIFFYNFFLQTIIFAIQEEKIIII